MASLNKTLQNIKDKSNDKNSINNMMLKQKFSKLFRLMRQDGNLEEKRVGLHASSIIKTDEQFCLREQVLSLLFEMEQGEELPLKALQIFAAGNSIHEKWQNMIMKCSDIAENTIKLVKNEARSYNSKYELLFTPDSIVEINDELYIIEYKSMNTYAYNTAINSANPHPSARKQAQLYMFLCGIQQAVILLEDKNTQDFSVFKVKFNYKEVLPFISRLSEIQQCKKEFLKDGVLPNKKCKAITDNRACNCNMKNACFYANKRIPIK